MNIYIICNISNVIIRIVSNISAIISHNEHMVTGNIFVQKIIISINEKGQRVDNFLFKKLKGVPKSMIYRILRQGKIRINQKRIEHKYRLLIGDEVSIPRLYKSRFKNLIFRDNKIISAIDKSIIYEDDHLIILNKPSGIAVHGGSGLSLGIIEGLRMLRPKALFLELVHRLDIDTSGVLLIAKKRSILIGLHRQLYKKKVIKNYLALVKGRWSSCISTVHVPILKKVMKNKKRIVQVSRCGKISETFFKVEEYYDFATLMRCSPITGRTHQIRVHAKYVGHPIAFDSLYGDCDFNKQLVSIGFTPRLFLHAIMLQFVHPYTEKVFQIRAPLSKEFKHCLNILRNKTYPNE